MRTLFISLFLILLTSSVANADLLLCTEQTTVSTSFKNGKFTGTVHVSAKPLRIGIARIDDKIFLLVGTANAELTPIYANNTAGNQFVKYAEDTGGNLIIWTLHIHHSGFYLTQQKSYSFSNSLPMTWTYVYSCRKAQTKQRKPDKEV